MANNNDDVKLTPREIEIVKLIKQGLSIRRIGVILEIEETTVHTHIKNIHNKTDTHNSVQVANLVLD